jgi:hypothetical protein
MLRRVVPVIGVTWRGKFSNAPRLAVIQSGMGMRKSSDNVNFRLVGERISITMTGYIRITHSTLLSGKSVEALAGCASSVVLNSSVARIICY